MRATSRHFLSRLRYTVRLLLPTMLVLFAVVEVRSAAAAHTAKKHRDSSHHRRSQARSWRAATRFARPRFRPRRTITVDTAAGFWRAWRRLRPRDEIVVHGVTFTGEVKLVDKQLPDWAEVHFDSDTRFVGVPSARPLPSVWINEDSHIRFYGGDVSDSASDGMAGTGVLVYDSSYLSWWGVRVHDVGGGGVFLAGVKKASEHLDFKGDVYDWGHNLEWDPHAIKGTGLQGVNVGDAHYGVDDSRLAFHVHDGARGSGMEIGGAVATDGARGNKIYLWCQHLTMLSAAGQAGNCAQVWGENVTGNTFEYVKAQRLSGRPYQTSGMFPNQSLATDRVVYGRASRTNLNRAYGSILWNRHAGTVFEDVAPNR
jgi:hypothetical protein